MRFIKKKIVILGMAAIMSVSSSTAFAASMYQTPADAVAGLTGRTVEEVMTERYDTGKTFGTIAAEAGKLDEFKKEVLEMTKDYYASVVTDGRITQAEADEAIAAVEARQTICDGTGNGACGMYPTGYGNGTMRTGNGRGRGMGRGFRSGSCAWN